MENQNILPEFLEKYWVHKKPEAMYAAEKKERRTGKTGIVKNSAERIQAYLGRIENILLNPGPDTRSRNIALLRPQIHTNVLIKEENFPDSYFEYQKQLAKEKGMGEVSFDENEKQEEIKKVVENQKLSLDSWIDYFTGDDCKYPTDVKYFAMQGILKLGKFDTAKYSFARRDKATTAPFAEIDHEALSTVLGALDAKHHSKDTSSYPEQLLKLIDKKTSFGDMYAETMRDLDSKSDKESLLPITDGEWRVFEKDSDPKALADALAGKRSNLCIADVGSAGRYLQTGSVVVFFSYNHAKQPTVPRIAVAFNDQGVYEVRGTYNKSEDIDPQMSATDVLSRRIKNLPGGESFMKKDADMRQVTDIEKKTQKGEALTKDDLIFLYEVNSSIEGFGYEKDPRIEEIRKKRNQQEDLPILFDCRQDQIAFKPSDLKADSLAYIGTWNPTVLKSITPNVKHIYESFPDKKVFLKTIETDPNIKSPADAEKEILAKGIKFYGSAQEILQKTTFSKENKEYKLASFSVESLGFPNGATTKEIYAKAESLGLEICPAEVGPLLHLNYLDQPNGEYLYIAMNSIKTSGGLGHVFYVSRDFGELKLSSSWNDPDSRWYSYSRFVFLRRKD